MEKSHELPGKPLEQADTTIPPPSESEYKYLKSLRGKESNPKQRKIIEQHITYNRAAIAPMQAEKASIEVDLVNIGERQKKQELAAKATWNIEFLDHQLGRALFDKAMSSDDSVKIEDQSFCKTHISGEVDSETGDILSIDEPGERDRKSDKSTYLNLAIGRGPYTRILDYAAEGLSEKAKAVLDKTIERWNKIKKESAKKE